MQNFLKALTSERKNIALPEEYNYFKKLIGSWRIDYVDNRNSHVMKGEWHFSWILEGDVYKRQPLFTSSITIGH